MTRPNVVAENVAKHGDQNQAITILIVSDQYLLRSIRNGAQLTREEGEITQKGHIKKGDQNMGSGKDWEELFNSPENKIKFYCYCHFISQQMREKIHLRFQ